MATDKQEKDLHGALIGDMADIASRFLPSNIFGGTPRPGKTILDDVLTLSEEAHEKESENSRIAPLLFTMGGGEPLWFVGDSPKRVLNDFKPERDNAICKGIVPEGKTPADGLLKRLGYAHRVYTFAMNIDGRRTNKDYVSATIDVDVDIPLFTPVDEYRKTGKQGRLDQLIRQAVLGKKGRRWLTSVRGAIDELVESGKIEETPYWKLKKAFMYFSKNLSLTPVVEVDPVTLKAHFTLYTAYMPMKVHQELTRIISETFFKGMYDEALTADNRMLALSRVGSMSKSDGLEGKFLYRRFLWFGYQDQKTLAVRLQFIRLGLYTPRLTDQQLSNIRSLAMENGVQVNHGSAYQYKAIQFASRHHPDNMATDEIDAYSIYAWAATKSVPYSFSMIKGIGGDMAYVVRSGLLRAENLFGKRTWVCAPLKNFADCDDAKLLGLNIAFGEGSGWDPESVGETRQKPLLRTWDQITVNHLIDYDEENEPTEDDEKDVKSRRDDDARPVRRRPRRTVGDESPAPVDDDARPVRRRPRRTVGNAEAQSTTPAVNNGLADLKKIIDEAIDDHIKKLIEERDNVEKKHPARPAPEAIEAPAPAPAAVAAETPATEDEDDHPVATDTAATSDDNNATSKNARSEAADRVNGSTKRPKLPVYDSINDAYFDLARISRALKRKMDIFLAEIRYAREPGVDTLMENPMKRLKRQNEYREAAREAMAADPSCQKLEAERSLILEVIERHERKQDRQLDLKEQEKKYGKLAWKRTLKEKSRTNNKGRRIGIEVLYLLMAKGQDCRFGGLFGDVARMAGLMTLILTVSSDKGGVTFDDKPHVLKGELNNSQWNAAVESAAKVISNVGHDIYSHSATNIARLAVDAALYGMGQGVHELAMDITTNPNLSREWLANLNKGLLEMGHPIVSGQFADPYSVRSRHRKIRNHEGKSLDVLSNVYMKGKRGALTPMESVNLTGAVLNFDTEPLHELPEKAAMKAAMKAMSVRPELHARRRDLKGNAAYIANVVKNANNGFRAARTPEEHAQNTAAFRHRRMDVIRRSGFVLEDQPITPKQAHEIVDAIKGDAYDSATESFTAIISLTKDMLGDKDHKYDNIHEIYDDISRSDGHWTDGEMAYLKALLAVHIEDLGRSAVKRKSYGSSRNIDFSAAFGRDWSNPKAMEKPWDGKVLAEEFAYITRDMRIVSHDDVINQDKEIAGLAFSKNRPDEQKSQEFIGGTPNFLTPQDINETPYYSIKVDKGPRLFRTDFLADHGSVRRTGTDAYREACQIFEPEYTFIHRGRRKTMTATEFMNSIDLSEVLNGKIYMTTDFTRNFGHGEASGKIDQFPCPTSSFLKAEKDEEGNVTIKSVADAHYIPDKTFVATTCLLSLMENKKGFSPDRSIKILHSIDKILATREYDGESSMPLSARYLEMQSGVNHNDCNRVLQELAAIGLIDRTGGELRGTLLGPADTEEQRTVQELCEKAGPGIIGQERATKQDFVESGQFLSTYTKFRTDGFIAERDGELFCFTAEEIIEAFKKLESEEDRENPVMMVAESAFRRLDAKVDRIRDFTEDSWRKSNLFEVRMVYFLGKVKLLTTDQYQNNASSVRTAIARAFGFVAPSRMDGRTDVDAAFRNTSKLYKGTDSGIMRTYGYLISSVFESDTAAHIPSDQILRELSKIIRFLSGRGDMASKILKQVSDFTGNLLTMEIAYRSWSDHAADLAAAAREFRRSYRALLGAVSKAARAPYRGDFDISSLASNGTPIKLSS